MTENLSQIRMKICEPTNTYLRLNSFIYKNTTIFKSTHCQIFKFIHCYMGTLIN